MNEEKRTASLTLTLFIHESKKVLCHHLQLEMMRFFIGSHATNHTHIMPDWYRLPTRVWWKSKNFFYFFIAFIHSCYVYIGIANAHWRWPDTKRTTLLKYDKHIYFSQVDENLFLQGVPEIQCISFLFKLFDRQNNNCSYFHSIWTK